MLYKINNLIRTEPFDGLTINKLAHTEALEVLLINMEKESLFPEHTSPKDANLLVLSGNITFHINGSSYALDKSQFFQFPKDEVHWVKANSNSQFLIIR